MSLIFFLSLVVSAQSFFSLWGIGSKSERLRAMGFAVSLSGQFVFVALDLLTGAYGLLLLFPIYTLLNVRGILNLRKTEIVEIDHA